MHDVRVVDPAKRSGAGGDGEVGAGLKLLTQLFFEHLWAFGRQNGALNIDWAVHDYKILNVG